MIDTSCPACVSINANRAPTRPQPMMMTNIRGLAAVFAGRPCRSRRGGYAWRSARQPHPARGIFEYIGRGVAHVEFAEFAFVADAHDDQVDLSLQRFVDDSCA